MSKKSKKSQNLMICPTHHQYVEHITNFPAMLGICAKCDYAVAIIRARDKEVIVNLPVEQMRRIEAHYNFMLQSTEHQLELEAAADIIKVAVQQQQTSTKPPEKCLDC